MEIEKQKEKKRKQHVRPWDKGKEGVKERREYTQEEWVEKQRKERKAEFAPPTSFQRSTRKESVENDDDDYDTSSKSLYFSTKKFDFSKGKTKETINPYKRNNDSTEHRTPIVNELSDDDNDDVMDERRGKGVEIAPPPTFDYYGAGSAKKQKKEHKKENLEDSISAGLKFLREQAEQKQKSHKRDADMFIM